MRDEYVRKAYISRVIDGDTVVAQVDLGFNMKYGIKIRVSNLDTPETFRPRCDEEREHGRQATLRAKTLLLGEDVHISSEKDPGLYGRYTASIELQDGRDYAETMKSEGFEKLSFSGYKNK